MERGGALSEDRSRLVAPLMGAALIAQRVAAGALRDGLFLSHYPVQSLPWFMAGTALLAVPASQLAGSVLKRRGPMRVAPILFGADALFFLVEWALLGPMPRMAIALLYLHSSLLGAIALSAFWSLLNERFDPHSAKPLMAKVAAWTSVGGLVGGVGAERAAALLPQGGLLLILSAVTGTCVTGALSIRRGAPPRKPPTESVEDRASGWAQIRRQPLLRDLALVIALAALLAALVDYVLKAEAVAHFGKGDALVRFFGLFYSGTALAAIAVQAMFGKLALSRLGLGGSLGAHPAAVGAGVVIGLALPPPLGGTLPRALDVTLRNSFFRSSYELLYTPLPEATKRAAKSIIDVAVDCAGKGIGAGAILLVVALAPGHPLAPIRVAAMIAAAGELLVARRLRAGYVAALEGGLRRTAVDLEPAPHYSLTDFTVAGSFAGLDRMALDRVLGNPAPPASSDPVVAAIAELRSGSVSRAQAALRDLPRDPVLIGALVPLLGRRDLMKPVIAALGSFGARAAGEMVSALLDPGTSSEVRRRLPVALKGCPSPIARDGLLAGLDAEDFEVRARCARALLALTDAHPELVVPFPSALAAVEREIKSGTDAVLLREHVFDLLALALDREPVRIAARSFSTEDVYVRGTALEYLETVLPPHLFSALRLLLEVSGAAPERRRAAEEVKAELIKAGATMTVSLDELRRQLEAAARDES